jgi:hypothetical protein
MASTSRASRKKVEDAKIFQVLEESTDSDVTIFLSEEDEDGNKPYSDEDGQLYDNSETKWHHICLDNFFSSTILMKMLLEQETYSCDIARANRKKLANRI